MRSTVVNSLDETTWRNFVFQHPASNIFHTPEMFEVFRRSKGNYPELWASLKDGGEILAVLPLVKVTLHDGLLNILTTRAIAYGGALSSPDSAGVEGMSSLVHAYIKKASGQVLFTEFRHLSDPSSILPVLEQYGFSYEDHLDYLIDLNRPPEQILENIGSRTRKHIRKGLRKGNVTIEILTQKGQILDWYNLIRNTYQTAQVPLADYSLFESAFDVLQPRGMIMFWLARVGEVPVAASAELLYKDVIYGWYGGVVRAYSSEVPGELLMWHILKWGAENGFRQYDFGGAGKPNEEYGVRDYKAKFGGILVCYGRNTYVTNKLLLKISQLGYKLYRKLL